MTSVKEIDFVDVGGQRFRFGLDADDQIFSLVLDGAIAGERALFVNGEDEVYILRDRDITLLVEAPL